MMRHLSHGPSAGTVGCVELLLRKAGDRGAQFPRRARDLFNPRPPLFCSGEFGKRKRSNRIPEVQHRFIITEMVRILTLDDRGDQRGSSFTLPEQQLAFLGSIVDVHFSTTLPGHVRGNHFHRLRKEVLVVHHEDSWTFAWDEGEGTAVRSRKFVGTGTVVVEIEPLASHAVLNDGQRPLLIFAMTNGPYDPGHPDAYSRRVL